MDTENMTIKEISSEIGRSEKTTVMIIRKLGKTYKYKDRDRHVKEALLSIDTASMTAKEISEKIGCNENHTRASLHGYKLPYKRRRARNGSRKTRKKRVSTEQYSYGDQEQINCLV